MSMSSFGYGDEWKSKQEPNDEMLDHYGLKRIASESWVPDKFPKDVVQRLENISSTGLSKGNLLDELEVRLPQSRSPSLIQYLKWNESINDIIKDDSIFHFNLVVIDQSGRTMKGYRYKYVDKNDLPSCDTRPNRQNSLSKYFSRLMSKTPETLGVPTGFRIIFSHDTQLPLHYIMDSKDERERNYVYIKESDFVPPVMRNQNASLEEETKADKWCDLLEANQVLLLHDSFRIQNKNRLARILELSKRGNIVNGPTLTSLNEETRITIHTLLEESRIFAEATDWVTLLPIRQTVKGRNTFTIDMLRDPVVKGSKIKILTPRTRNNPEETCLELSHILASSSNPMSDDDDEWNGVVHTFDLVEGGSFEANFDTKATVEWEIVESPTFQWLSSQPPEKFSDLQLVLLKHGVSSNPEFHSKLYPRGQSRQHVIISGESGTGKSTVLKRLTKRFLDEHLVVANSTTVVCVEFSDMIEFLESKLDKVLLAKAIIASVRKLPSFKAHNCNQLYEKLVTPTMSSDLVYLLLDGLDHVGFEKLEKGFQILELLESEFPHLSLYVTTRPHLVLRLEAILKTFAYNLEDMDEPSEFYQYIGSGGHFYDQTEINSEGNRFFHTPIGVKVLMEVAEYLGVRIQVVSQHNSKEAGSSVKDIPSGIRLNEIYRNMKLDYIKEFINIMIGNYAVEYVNMAGLESTYDDLLAGLRYYAVELMCPAFSSSSGFSSIVLGGITKRDLKNMGLHPFPQESALCHGVIAEFVLAEILHELTNKWNVKGAFELLATFLENYYLLGVEKLSVYDRDSVFTNFELQAKLHFANVFELLNSMWQTNPPHGPTCPPFRESLKQILFVAAFYGHQSIFRYFFRTQEYVEELKLNYNWIEFVVSAEKLDDDWFNLFDLGRNPDLEVPLLVNMLEFQSTTKNGIFWNSDAVYNRLFDTPKYHNTDRIAHAILREMQIGYNNAILQARIFRLISNSENIEITSSVMKLLKFILSLNPALANRIIYRTNYWTTLQFLLQVNVNPIHFSHPNPIFQDLYQLVSRLPDSTQIGKETIMETVERGLAEDILKGGWVHECKTWYTDLYHQTLDRMYQIWLLQHEDWWSEDECMSKHNFLRACASYAFNYRFPGRKNLFGGPKDFQGEEEVLKDIGLIIETGEASTPHLFHETIADYLIAWVISKAGFSVDAKDFKDFLLESVFNMENSMEEEEVAEGKENMLGFKHFFICYFLDELTNDFCRAGDLLERGTKECLQVIPGVEVILQACYDSTHYNLLNLFARETYEHVFMSEVAITKLLFRILENIRWEVVDIAVTLIKYVRTQGLLDTVTNENDGETIFQIARRACRGKPFEEEIATCFPVWKGPIAFPSKLAFRH